VHSQYGFREQKELKPSTVKSYLSSIKVIHGLANVSYSDPIITSMRLIYDPLFYTLKWTDK